MRSAARRCLPPLLFVALTGVASLDCSSPEPPGTLPALAREDAGASGPAPAASAAEVDVGAVTLRRLNAVEYDNTVRDLLGDTTRPGRHFPPDDGAYGFTNIGAALNISPLLLEQYEQAASKLAASAVTSRDLITCTPESTPEAKDCARQILAPLLRRAWRRHVEAAEIEALVAIAVSAQQNGLSFGDAMAVAIKALLLSPSFLFHVEIDPDPTSTAAHDVDDYELASRLSYFLWSTMPDDALFAYAEAGKLAAPRVLDRQVRRMLADPKAQALLDNFASQWLLHTFDLRTPDMVLFPSFDDELRAAMAAETRAFVGSFLFGEEPLPDMLDAPFSFLNERLGAHYGVPGLSGDTLVRVPLDPASHRGGLLTHGSVLTMTSVATRTSVVRRGEWVLAELLCSPPPAPPANVPALPPAVTVGTMRERLEEHRKNPACRSCHTQMDPIGFALEHYDAIGRWRDTDQGQPIDATGSTPTGQTFDGGAELSAVLKADSRFVDCATRKLFTYALGRVPGAFDEPRLKGLVKAFAKDGYVTRNLIVNIIGSDAFRKRRGGS